ncbi:MAG TPA: acetoacetate decarboxylase family protein [Azospirillum sp.]|nr:acetoacetate decarboxylase family protein [Azospirillum sp.]
MALPDYVSFRGHGEVSIAAPGVFTDSTSTLFFVRADPARTQALVDKILNAASDGAVRYEVLGPFAAANFLSVGRCTSPTEEFGWIPYKEASLWLPVIEHRRGRLPRLLVWMPYMFPDAMIPIACGRESWGFAKSMGRITVPAGCSGPTTFQAETMLFHRLSSDCQGEVAPLLTAQSAQASLGGLWKTLADLVADAGDVLKTLVEPGGLAESMVVVADAAAMLLTGTVPVVNLKQFRDAADSGKACYQALVNCPMHINDFRGAWPLLGDWTLKVADGYASHRVVEDFGFQTDGTSANVHVDLAVTVHMDFQANPGKTVWQAG